MRSTLGILGGAAALALCCAAPALIAVGGLGLFGALSGGPSLIGAALIVLAAVAAVAWFVAWRRGQSPLARRDRVRRGRRSEIRP